MAGSVTLYRERLERELAQDRRLRVAQRKLVCQLERRLEQLDTDEDGLASVEELEAELNFETMAIGFNVTYLLDALMAIDAGTVVMELKDPNSSCLISADGGGDDRHVVMPLKL